jgi:hypothetical protein
LAGAVAIAVLGVAGVAEAFTVPSLIGTGVSSPGYPDFWGANVEANLTQSGRGNSATFTLSLAGSTSACSARGTLAACSAAIFNFPSAAYLVGNESINLTATFNSSGQLLSGTYAISGSLPASSSPTFGSSPAGYSWGSQPTQTLLTANLTADTVNSGSQALGFSATFTGGWADTPQFTGGNTTESVWLYSLLSGRDETSGQNMGNSAWNSFLAQLKSGSGLKANTFYGIASIATVPIPGAVWLLGSGLAGLGAMLRRRRAGAQTQVA